MYGLIIFPRIKGNFEVLMKNSYRKIAFSLASIFSILMIIRLLPCQLCPYVGFLAMVLYNQVRLNDIYFQSVNNQWRHLLVFYACGMRVFSLTYMFHSGNIISVAQSTSWTELFLSLPYLWPFLITDTTRQFPSRLLRQMIMLIAIVLIFI